MEQLNSSAADCDKAYAQGWREACEAACNLAKGSGRSLRAAQYRAACVNIAAEIHLLADRQPDRHGEEMKTLRDLLLDYARLSGELVGVCRGMVISTEDATLNEVLKEMAEASQALAARCYTALDTLRSRERSNGL